jgi:hypothetical protein
MEQRIDKIMSLYTTVDLKVMYWKSNSSSDLDQMDYDVRIVILHHNCVGSTVKFRYRIDTVSHNWVRSSQTFRNVVSQELKQYLFNKLYKFTGVPVLVIPIYN